MADILEYRQLTKLKSTYADGLVNYIAEDGRIHTSFNQTITATGRISSTEPNLQNIPMRIELGRLIRKAFCQRPVLCLWMRIIRRSSCACWRICPGMKLIEAYRNAQDIHRTTASQVFHIPFDEVTDLQRRNAKAVNFGIVYGISSFGLSQDLSITKKRRRSTLSAILRPIRRSRVSGRTGGGGEGKRLCHDDVRKKTSDSGAFFEQFYAAFVRGAHCDEFPDTGNGGRHY